METVLRRYGWAIDLVAILFCAVFLAHVASMAVNGDPVTAVPGRGPVVADEVAAAKDMAPIIARNIFCSSCGGSPSMAPPGRLVDLRTNLPLAVMAIMYAPPPLDGRSIAIVRDTVKRVVHVLRVSDKLLGATILDIGNTRIRLRNQGRTEFLDLLDNPTRDRVAEVAPLPAGDSLSAELARGIKKTGERSYEIQRATLESMLGSMSELTRGTRIIPEARDGRVAGFRLYRVNPDGPWARIGMQSGDVLSAINGFELTSPERALDAYGKFRSASHVNLGLERNGRPLTLEYWIH